MKRKAVRLALTLGVLVLCAAGAFLLRVGMGAGDLSASLVFGTAAGFCFGPALLLAYDLWWPARPPGGRALPSVSDDAAILATMAATSAAMSAAAAANAAMRDDSGA